MQLSGMLRQVALQAQEWQIEWVLGSHSSLTLTSTARPFSEASSVTSAIWTRSGDLLQPCVGHGGLSS